MSRDMIEYHRHEEVDPADQDLETAHIRTYAYRFFITPMIDYPHRLRIFRGATKYGYGIPIPTLKRMEIHKRLTWGSED